MSSSVPGMAFAMTFAAASFFASAASGDMPTADPDAPKPHATVSLISESDTFTPGSTITLGLSFAIEKDWHLYWNGRNDTGLAPSAEFTLPEGFTMGEWQWPAPIRHVLPGDILDHVYEGRVTLIIPVHIAADVKPRSAATISAKVDWLVCNEACVPESGEVKLTLPIGPSTPPGKRSPDDKFLAEARNRVPTPLPADGKAATIKWTKDKVQIAAPGAAGLAFFPATDCIELAHPIADTATDGASLTINVKLDDNPALRGVLEVRRPGKPTVYYTIDAKPMRAAPPDVHPPKSEAPAKEPQAPTSDRR